MSTRTRKCNSTPRKNGTLQPRKFHGYASSRFHCQLSAVVDGGVWTQEWLWPRKKCTLAYLCIVDRSVMSQSVFSNCCTVSYI